MTRANQHWTLRDAKTLKEEQVDLLLRVAVKHSLKAHVLLSVCYNGAFRACELTHLKAGDFDFSVKKVSVIPAKKARRNGRDLPAPVDYPMPDNVLALVGRWIRLNELSPEDWLFAGRVRVCKVVKYNCPKGHLSVKEAQRLFDEVAGLAKLKVAQRGIHTLKHARLSELARKTRDPWFVKEAGRHESISMSDTYVKVTDFAERIRKIGSIV